MTDLVLIAAYAFLVWWAYSLGYHRGHRDGVDETRHNETWGKP